MYLLSAMAHPTPTLNVLALSVTGAQPSVSEVPPPEARVLELSLKKEPLTTNSGDHLYTMNVDPRTGEAPAAPSVPVQAVLGDIAPGPIKLPLVPPIAIVSPNCGGEQDLLDEVKAQGAARREAMEDSPNTDSAYSRHYGDYRDWWEADQGQRKARAASEGKTFCYVSALPILTYKACLFLEFSRTRPRVSLRALYLQS